MRCHLPTARTLGPWAYGSRQDRRRRRQKRVKTAGTFLKKSRNARWGPTSFVQERPRYRRRVARGTIRLASRADAEVAQQPIADVVDPAVHVELLPAPPRVAHHGGVGHAHHLLDDVELAEAIAAFALAGEGFEPRAVLGAPGLNVLAVVVMQPALIVA